MASFGILDSNQKVYTLNEFIHLDDGSKQQEIDILESILVSKKKQIPSKDSDMTKYYGELLKAYDNISLIKKISQYKKNILSITGENGNNKEDHSHHEAYDFYGRSKIKNYFKAFSYDEQKTREYFENDIKKLNCDKNIKKYLDNGLNSIIELKRQGNYKLLKEQTDLYTRVYDKLKGGFTQEDLGAFKKESENILETRKKNQKNLWKNILTDIIEKINKYDSELLNHKHFRDSSNNLSIIALLGDLAKYDGLENFDLKEGKDIILTTLNSLKNLKIKEFEINRKQLDIDLNYLKDRIEEVYNFYNGNGFDYIENVFDTISYKEHSKKIEYEEFDESKINISEEDCIDGRAEKGTLPGGGYGFKMVLMSTLNIIFSYGGIDKNGLIKKVKIGKEDKEDIIMSALDGYYDKEKGIHIHNDDHNEKTGRGCGFINNALNTPFAHFLVEDDLKIIHKDIKDRLDKKDEKSFNKVLSGPHKEEYIIVLKDNGDRQKIARIKNNEHINGKDTSAFVYNEHLTNIIIEKIVKKMSSILQKKYGENQLFNEKILVNIAKKIMNQYVSNIVGKLAPDKNVFNIKVDTEGENNNLQVEDNNSAKVISMDRFGQRMSLAA